MNDAAATLCVDPSRQIFLIAQPDRRCWLMEIGVPTLTPLPLSNLAAERATLAATVVEGAIAAGLTRSGPRPHGGGFTFPRYLRWLAGNYEFAGQTAGLFRRGAERLAASGQKELAKFARRKAAEESGHAQLALRDLRALGLSAATVQFIQPPSARAFAERFCSYVESPEPSALFGFSYCMERMAMGRDRAFVEMVESICPPGVRAFRFLKVHSNLGSDRAHVIEQLAVFESLSAKELTAVSRAAYETAGMLAQQASTDQELSDQEIQRRLRISGMDLSLSPSSGSGKVQREQRGEVASSPCSASFPPRISTT